MKRAPGFAARHPAVVGLPAGGLIGIAVLAFGVHFADTRNWAGLAVTGGALLALIAGTNLWCRVERKRATGTYSYRAARAEQARRKRQEARW